MEPNEEMAPPSGAPIIEAEVVEETPEEEAVEEAPEGNDPPIAETGPVEITPVGIMANIAAPIEVAIYKHAGKGEDPSWMAGSLVMPSPDGQGLALQQYITLSIGSPLLGEQPPTATAMVDLRQLRDASTAERLVQQLFVNAREMRSKMLDEANPDRQPQPDFSDLVQQPAG
jgi:hypothetical protein